ncbi:MAG: hypothetical protein ABF690_00475 [Liquorilactobacillus nagelii]|uniref:hypothetical protein n=1 Tax=Oenococcus sicerae TaxID=2203724 RepID=UPI0039ECBAA7
MNESNVDELKLMIRDCKGVLMTATVNDIELARYLVEKIDLLKKRILEEAGDEYDG